MTTFAQLEADFRQHAATHPGGRTAAALAEIDRLRSQATVAEQERERARDDAARAHRAEARVAALEADLTRAAARLAAQAALTHDADAEREHVVARAIAALVAVEPVIGACKYAVSCGSCVQCRYHAALRELRERGGVT